jgi:hypothetical protein
VKIKMEKTENNQSEESVIREVAEEEGMTYEEVKEMWDTFKDTARNAKAKRSVTKPKTNKSKEKSKKKQAKKSKKRNR